MNRLFDEEIRGHHSMRDHLLTVVFEADLAYKLPGQNPTLGGQLIEMGDIQGVYTHSFETFKLDWAMYLKALERDAGESWAAWIG